MTEISENSKEYADFSRQASVELSSGPARNGYDRREISSRAIKMIFALTAIFIYVTAALGLSLVGVSLLYFPSFDNVILLLLAYILSTFIKNSYANLVFLFWCVWFIFGSISLFAQNQLDIGLNYNVSPVTANRLYLLCVIGGISGAIFAQLLNRRFYNAPVTLPFRGSHPVVWMILLLFPFAYVVSIIATTHSIPIISGRDISSEMYEVNYGPLHAFGIFIPVVSVMVWMKFNDQTHPASRMPFNLIAIAAFMVFVVSAVIDGRRVLALFTLGSALIYYLAMPGKAARWIWGSVLSGLGLIGYVSESSLRAGGNGSDVFENLFKPLATVGTEYRDYVYCFTRFSQAHVKNMGYDWLGSTLATLTPSFLMAALGLDKDALSIHDSARTLNGLLNVTLGIRIGLVGELWFFIGWYSILAFFFFGMLIYVTAFFATRSSHFVFKSILVVQLAIFMLSVNGQSTVTFGLILPLCYLAIGVASIEFLFRIRVR